MERTVSPIEGGDSIRAQAFYAGGGETGELLRTKDWSQTPLGPIDTWPQNLRTCIRIMLTSRQPIWIGWGKELIKLYNDPYKAIVRGKHPWAFGAPASLVWKDIWRDIDPLLNKAMKQDEGTYVESQLLIMERNGYPEETYYTFSYTPVSGEDGLPAGIICANTDDTDRIISERQLMTLTQLGKKLINCTSHDEVIERTIDSLKGNPHDFPFVLFYSMEGKTALLSRINQASADNALVPIEIDLDANNSLAHCLKTAVETKRLQVLEEVRNHFGVMPNGAWAINSGKAIVLPVLQTGAHEPYGLLITGLNPYRPLDEKYGGFFELVADQIASSFADVRVLEEERKRAAALAEIDRAKTLFFSNVSHEFRTPLTLMLGPLREMLNDQPQPLQREPLEMVYRNGLRLQKLVNTLLDFSRIEAGRMQANYRPVNLSALTADLASSFRSAIEKAGMDFVVHTPPLSGEVFVDTDMWEKIVLNLLSNAFKFTFEGRIEIALTEEGEQVVLRVADTGEGIRGEDIPYIFERFKRVEGARSRTFEGSGIGLSLVQDLVKLHGGSIKVESTVRKGTTFRIALPRGKAHLPPNQIQTSTAQSTAIGAKAYIEEAVHWMSNGTHRDKQQEGNGLLPGFTYKPRIVLADDNADMRSYVQRLLSDRFDIAAVANGKEALQLVHTLIPELVLSDIMMPEMDGLSLLQAIKSDPLTQHIPVVLLSARAGEEAKLEGIDAGADDYMVKPFSASELIARVSAIVTAKHTRQETETRLYKLFMQVPALIVVTRGPEHVFELANRSAMEVIGKGEMIIGKPVREVLPELAQQGFVDVLDTAFRTGRSYQGNQVLVKLDREGKGVLKDFYFDFVYQPIHDGKKVDGILVHAVDVTGQVMGRKELGETNTRLRASEEKFRTLADNIPNLCWMSDHDGRVFWYNSRWYEYTGLTAADPADWASPAVHDPQVWPLVWEKWNESLRKEELFEMVFPVKGANGHYRPFLTRILPVRDEEGKILQWFGTATDITERENLARQKDEFMSIASHELKTPVTSIKASIQIINRLFGEKQFEKAGNFLTKADMHINKLTGLINDLLDVSRIQAGKLQYDFSVFAIRDIVDDAVEQIAYQSNNHHIAINGGSSLQVYADRARLEQVINNLVVNAIKYSPGADKVIIDIAEENEMVKVTVTDFGIGIPAEKLPYVFDRFFRVEKTSQQFQGLGLGLYICFEIIKRHGGQISLRSVEGKGSQFWFTIPVYSVAAATESMAAPEKS